MIERGKHSVLGVLVNAIDYQAAVERILQAAAEGRSLSVTALAVHGVMTGVWDAEQRYRLNHLDLVVPDGQPVRWGLNWLHRTGLAERVYGPELTLRVCQACAERGLAVYLYGSRAEVLEALQGNLEKRFPGLRIAGSQPSAFRRLEAVEQLERVEQIRASGARLVLVGLGCPRQEVWIYEHRELLRIPLLAVGAAFDFHAGNLAQAPAWMQRAGLEWLYRFLKEPRRLWKRYLLLNPAYLFLLGLQLLRLRRFEPDDCRKPEEALRYG